MAESHPHPHPGINPTPLFEAADAARATGENALAQAGQSQEYAEQMRQKAVAAGAHGQAAVQDKYVGRALAAETQAHSHESEAARQQLRASKLDMRSKYAGEKSPAQLRAEFHNSDERQAQIRDLNDIAELRLFGAKPGREYFVPGTQKFDEKGFRIEGTPLTRVNPANGQVEWINGAPPKGKIDWIRNQQRFGKTPAERDAIASDYSRDIQEMLDSGMELAQAEMVADLRLRDHENLVNLTAEFMRPPHSMDAADAQTRAAELINKKDAQRVRLIQEKGIMTPQEYEAARRGDVLLPTQPKPAEEDTKPPVPEVKGLNSLPEAEQKKFKAVIGRIASARLKMASGANRKAGKEGGKDYEELQEAQNELSRLIENAEGIDKMQAAFDANADIDTRQLELSKPAKLYHKKWARIALAVAAGVATGAGVGAVIVSTGGLAALGLPLVAAGALKGLFAGVAGGVAGGLTGDALARSQRVSQPEMEKLIAGQNDKVSAEVKDLRAAGDYADYAANLNDAYLSEYAGIRAKNASERNKTVGKTAIYGGVGGAALGGAIGVAVDLLGGGGESAPGTDTKTPGVKPPVEVPPADLPAAKEAVIEGILETDPEKLNTLPGLDVKVDVVTPQEAAAQYTGNIDTTYDGLMDGANLNNAQTVEAFREGWTKLHNVPGVQIDTWGDIQFDQNTGEYKITGDLWGGDITADKLTVVDANGEAHRFDGKLTNSQHAALLDLVRQDGVRFISGNENLAAELAKSFNPSPEAVSQALEAVSDQIVNEVNAEARQLAPDLNNLVAEDAAAIREQAIKNVMSKHLGSIGRMPEAFREAFLADIARTYSIPDQIIHEYLASLRANLGLAS